MTLAIFKAWNRVSISTQPRKELRVRQLYIMRIIGPQAELTNISKHLIKEIALMDK